MARKEVERPLAVAFYLPAISGGVACLIAVLTPMTPDAAIATACLGAALALVASIFPSWLRTPLAAVLITVAGALAAIALVETALGIDLGPDKVLHQHPIGISQPLPAGHMSIVLAAAILLVSIALPLRNWELKLSSVAADAAGLLSLVLPLLGILGHAYGEPALYRFASSTTLMPLGVAGALTLIGGGALFLNPERGMSAMLTADTPGGALARLLLPAVLVVPAAAGWLSLQGERAGLYSGERAIAIIGLGTIAVFVIAVYLAAQAYNRADSRRRGLEDERKRLIRRLANAHEEERNRIANDLHDDAVQVMTAVGLRLNRLRRTLTQPQEFEQLQGLEREVERATARLRGLLFELSAPSIDSQSVEQAVADYLDQHREGGSPAASVTGGFDTQPPAELRLLIYRICQEALTNARKHAHASQVRVAFKQRDGGFLVRILDNGVGFPTARLTMREPGHLGLDGMRQRARAAGGWLRIRTAPRRGTMVEFWLPGAVNGSPELELKKAS